MDKIDIYNEWKHYAETDFNSAMFLQQMIPLPIEIICYHCQQSVEKHLKAFLILNDVNPPKTHDLNLLLNICIKFKDNFSKIHKEAIYINQYGIQPRYPNNLDITKDDMELVLKMTRTVQDFCNQIL